METLGIYGGSFNPPHNGHSSTILQVLNSGLVDRIEVLPVFKHPHGKDLVDFDIRVAMVNSMLEAFNRNLVGTSILETRNPTGESIELVRLYVQNNPNRNYRLIIGSDILNHFESWRGYEEIVRLAKPIVVARDLSPFAPQEQQDRAEHASDLATKYGLDVLYPAAQSVSSTWLRGHLKMYRDKLHEDPYLEIHLPTRVLKFLNAYKSFNGKDIY